MSTISNNINTLQGPTPEEWDNMRTHIHHIYILEGQPLKVVISRMESEHSFRATAKMYNTYFEKWKPFFNKNRTRNRGAATEHAARAPRTRPRRLQNGARPSSTNRPGAPILPTISFDPVLCNGYTAHGAVIRSTRVYVYGLFDSCRFSGTVFDVVVPPGLPDNTATWQQVSDECFGASVLMAKGDYRAGFETIDRVCQKLKDVVGTHDCSMVIKLWRVCVQLYDLAAKLRNFEIMKGFLRFFWELSVIRYHKVHPISKLLGGLRSVPLADLPEVLEAGYLQTIHCLQERLGSRNAVVLSTWSRYSKRYTRQRLAAGELLSGYRHVLREAEETYTPGGTRTIEILFGYMYAAYYNAGDCGTTQALALELVDRVEYLLRSWDRPEWCLIVQGYALAVKLLYIISRSTCHAEQSTATLKLAISIFQRGGRECQTRAVMLRGILGQEI
ncbi:hypothetical protein LZ31DRAFT_475454 [Colletotrichum somersetense]|nr:hypothetical protein LZ31DRAFT_475454 [Colletotrichum somersetense]